MRYNLESTLPINAFSPRGGRGPFSRGMTLEGGGGGVLKPVTKALGSVAKGATDVVKGVVQPVYNATLKQIPGVDKALVGLDKAVGKTIPGGWGTVAAVASSFIPGAQLAAMGMTKTGLATGLGALSGSGVMKKGHEFNLQGAIVGGAMAYGASQLATGLQEAGSTTSAIENAARAETGQIAANLGVQGAGTGAGSQAAMLASQNAGFGAEGIKSIASGANTAIQAAQSAGATLPGVANFAYNAAGEMVPANISADITGAITPTTVVPQPTGLQALGTNLTEAGKGTLSNIADAGTGIKNLTGFGTGASEAATKFAAPITKEGAIAGIMGYSGMAALEEQKKALEEQRALGAIGDAEYAKAKASIDDQIATANRTVSDNPFSTDPDRSFEKQDTLYAGSSPTDTLYSRPSSDVSASKTLYAVGGSVDDESGMDEARGLNQGNLQNGLFGGGIASFAAGGTPRFLSGGGDGMSDSIKASINGTQEARLADGEFVIPADVVSHIGNGSSKAGAKQLYSMMDRVRQARVGTKKQGRKINPRKYMAA
jgi:hypothetical protein